jgi:hypothetical protein
MVEDLLGSDVLDAYLMVASLPHGASRITVIHSLAPYSAGFGGANTLHVRTLGLMGEMVSDQLPMMIQLPDDPNLGLAHALLLENVIIQPEAATDAYFAGPNALDVMPVVPVLQGVVNSNLSCLCPVPLAWAPYFLDYKTPFAAYTIGRELVATLANAAERAQVNPFLDWMRASTQR